MALSLDNINKKYIGDKYIKESWPRMNLSKSFLVMKDSEDEIFDFSLGNVSHTHFWWRTNRLLFIILNMILSNFLSETSWNIFLKS